MNKFIKFTAALMLAVVVTACNGDDPKADYKKFVDWNKQQSSVQNEMVQEFQKSLTEAKDSAAVDAAIKHYQDNANTIIASLDKLDVKSKEVQDFKQKTKDLLKLSVDVTVESAKAFVAPMTEEAKAKLQGQLEELNKSLKDVADTDKALQQKYGEPAAPAESK